MSLADELLADLEDGAEEEDDQDVEEVLQMMATVPEDVVMETVDPLHKTLGSIAKLKDSEQLSNVIDQIEFFSQKGERQTSGPLEADPEYQLIVEANNITVEIDNEINVIHKFVRDIYYKRFPELESLVPQPLEYMRTVKELGNDILQRSVLLEYLTPATIMVVSVTASTTQGKELTAEDLVKAIDGCNMAIDLTAKKESIRQYVESRMTFFAPNLTVIVGSTTSAKLMGVAGGLTKLSNMPACNLLIVGSQKRVLSGFSSTALLPNTGFIYHCDIVQKTPMDLRRKAARLVAAKSTLAARVDSFHESPDGATGRELRADIERKLDKLQEPPPVKTNKPLPAPIEVSRKKRGGRRYRKMKERLGMTEMRKAANRLNFGEIEEDAYQEDLGFSLGHLGKSRSGRVRGPPVDSKTKAKISRTLQQKLHRSKQTWGGSSTVKKQISGTASSVAFTPLQGLEIVNPQAAETQARQANQRYFCSSASFVNIQKK